jgi:hypothetical protein
VPSGFEIDVTDPMLYNSCGVRLPEMCESQSDTVTSAAAPSLALPPLVYSSTVWNIAGQTVSLTLARIMHDS